MSDDHSRAFYTRLPRDEAEAVAMQTELAGCVVVADDDTPIETIAGLDIAYDKDSDAAVATAVVLRRSDLAEIDQAVVRGTSDFPYIPGLLAFRELPLLLKAIEALSVTPDLYVCDGYGLTHPRRFGLACHLGVILDAPAIGVAKSPPHLPVEAPGLRARRVDPDHRERRDRWLRAAHPGRREARLRLGRPPPHPRLRPRPRARTRPEVPDPRTDPRRGPVGPQATRRHRMTTW